MNNLEFIGNSKTGDLIITDLYNNDFIPISTINKTIRKKADYIRKIIKRRRNNSKVVDKKMDYLFHNPTNQYSSEQARLKRELVQKIDNILLNNESKKSKSEIPNFEIRESTVERTKPQISFQENPSKKAKKEDLPDISFSKPVSAQKSNVKHISMQKILKKKRAKQNAILQQDERANEVVKSPKANVDFYQEDQIIKEVSAQIKSVKAKLEEDKLRAKLEEDRLRAELSAKIIETRQKINQEKVNKNARRIACLKRKINSVKDSIKSLKYNSIFKRRVIAGCMSIFAFGTTLFGVNDFDGIKKNYSILKSNISSFNISFDTIDSMIESKIFPDIPVYKPDKPMKRKNTVVYDSLDRDSLDEDDKLIYRKIIDKDGNVKEYAVNVTGTGVALELDKIEKEAEQTVFVDNSFNTSMTLQEFTKYNKFKEFAYQKYNEKMEIGKKPETSKLFDNIYFTENPDGTGKKGFFNKNSDYYISHITVITSKGWKTVKTNGANLADILKQYPGYESYNICFSNSKTKSALGFVTKEQYENIINEIVNKKFDEMRSKNKQTNERYDEFSI